MANIKSGRKVSITHKKFIARIIMLKVERKLKYGNDGKLIINVSELSRIFNLTRPTIYKLMKVKLFVFRQIITNKSNLGEIIRDIETYLENDPVINRERDIKQEAIDRSYDRNTKRYRTLNSYFDKRI